MLKAVLKARRSAPEAMIEIIEAEAADVVSPTALPEAPEPEVVELNTTVSDVIELMPVTPTYEWTSTIYLPLINR